MKDSHNPIDWLAAGETAVEVMCIFKITVEGRELKQIAAQLRRKSSGAATIGVKGKNGCL